MSQSPLVDLIRNHTARVAVIGQGYVGLPLAVEYGRVGFAVTGLDTDQDRVVPLNLGRSHSPDVSSEDLGALRREGRYEATSDFSVLEQSDVVIICVPTPLRKSKDPDISYIVAAAEQVAARFRPHQLVVLESTTYPGTTEELLLPMFEARGARVGENFFLAFSPERIDPANRAFKLHEIPKVVGGVTAACTEMAALLYRQIVGRVVPVSSPKVAELAKLYENVFRNVNIAMANEFALMCRRLDVSTREVIGAAASKPFGFMPFYPGPGLGGHCIPIDPFYLSWKARASGFEARFIELAGHVNGHMPEHVVDLVSQSLNNQGKAVHGSRVLVLGVAYKADIDDTRESPSLDIMTTLVQRGARVDYSDPHVPDLELAGRKLRSVPLTAAKIRGYDCVVIATAHRDLPLGEVARSARGIVDTRNALRGRKSKKIVRI